MKTIVIAAPSVPVVRLLAPFEFHEMHGYDDFSTLVASVERLVQWLERTRIAERCSLIPMECHENDTVPQE
jgi:hypothetical protein